MAGFKSTAIDTYYMEIRISYLRAYYKNITHHVTATASGPLAIIADCRASLTTCAEAYHIPRNLGLGQHSSKNLNIFCNVLYLYPRPTVVHTGPALSRAQLTAGRSRPRPVDGRTASG